jgi:UDP-3-O-acyl-N-acetylglucosamine deacetylase
METTPVVPAFEASLKRNNKQIKGDRAEAISEDTQMAYKRAVEDLQITIKRLKRKQDNMLDLSPDNSLTLKLAENFDSDAYVQADTELGVQIRNEGIKLEIASARYSYLFGEMS